MTVEDDPARWAQLRDIDLEHPNPARMYDYYLGGAHNFAADREAADKVLAVLPATRTFARDNRSFLRRVVRYLVAEAGITQLLDLGSGIPTVGNSHEIAQRLDPDARVVYVDHEPVAVQTAQEMLKGNSTAAIIGADLRDISAILSHPETRRLLDFSRPLAVIMASVMPFIPDEDDPAAIIAGYRDACPPGSYLALSHGLTVDYWPDGAEDTVSVYSSTTHPLHPRTPDQIRAFFAGYELVEPGVVYTAAWHPDHAITADEAKASCGMAGLGRLP